MSVNPDTVAWYCTIAGAPYLLRIHQTNGDWLRNETNPGFLASSVQSWVDVILALPRPHPVPEVEEIMDELIVIIVRLQMEVS